MLSVSQNGGIRMNYKGIFPQFYACYDADGQISPARIKAYASFLLKKGITGLYVGGTAGESQFQSPEERKKVLENVMEVCKGQCMVIAQISAPSTAESIALADHAQKLGVDAIAATPPPLCSESAIYEYWAEIAKTTKLDLLLCNRPLPNGCHLPLSFFQRALEHPRVVGILNESPIVSDIAQFKTAVGRERVVFQGVDRQLAPGLLMGADAGISEMCGVMPELYLKVYRCMEQADVKTAREIQAAINDIICKMQKVKGSTFAILKSILRVQGMEIGPVRPPLEEVDRLEQDKVQELAQTISLSVQKFC